MRSCIILKDATAKNFVANVLTNITILHLCLHSVAADCILSIFFPTETDVLVPAFSQSTDVAVVNFFVVLKFSIMLR